MIFAFLVLIAVSGAKAKDQTLSLPVPFKFPGFAQTPNPTPQPTAQQNTQLSSYLAQQREETENRAHQRTLHLVDAKIAKINAIIDDLKKSIPKQQTLPAGYLEQIVNQEIDKRSSSLSASQQQQIKQIISQHLAQNPQASSGSSGAAPLDEDQLKNLIQGVVNQMTEEWRKEIEEVKNGLEGLSRQSMKTWVKSWIQEEIHRSVAGGATPGTLPDPSQIRDAVDQAGLDQDQTARIKELIEESLKELVPIYSKLKEGSSSKRGAVLLNGKEAEFPNPMDQQFSDIATDEVGGFLVPKEQPLTLEFSLSEPLLPVLLLISIKGSTSTCRPASWTLTCTDNRSEIGSGRFDAASDLVTQDFTLNPSTSCSKIEMVVYPDTESVTSQKCASPTDPEKRYLFFKKRIYGYPEK